MNAFSRSVRGRLCSGGVEHRGQHQVQGLQHRDDQHPRHAPPQLLNQ